MWALLKGHTRSTPSCASNRSPTAGRRTSSRTTLPRRSGLYATTTPLRLFRRKCCRGRLRRFLLRAADRVEAAPQRVHQVHHLRRFLHVLDDDLATLDLRVDDLPQPFLVV